MSSPGSNPMDAVAALMLERQRFEAWIAALEAKRAITPPHVYERVRGDYETRLREVVQKLIGRTTDLKETVAALTARLAKLQYVIPRQTMLIEAPIAVLTTSENRDVANRFIRYTKTAAAQRIFAQFGYRPLIPSVYEEFEKQYPRRPGVPGGRHPRVIEEV